MSNDIRDIIERLAILEGRITPTTVKHGLNPQQKEVPQLPALFKPKHISVLNAKTDPKHPMAGYMVGASESAVADEEADKEVIESSMSRINYLMQEIGAGDVDIYDIYANPETEEERYASKIVNRMYDDVAINHGLHPDDNFEEILDIVTDQIAQDYPMDNTLSEAKVDEEKLLDKVKKSLTDYLASIEDKYKDADIKEKKKDDRDLGKKAADKDLVAKEKKNNQELDEDPTEDEPAPTDLNPPVLTVNPTYAESAPVKTVTMEDGRVCEIHGDERSGFEIRHGNRSLKSRFKNIDEAAMALEMYCARAKKQDQSADYIEEA